MIFHLFGFLFVLHSFFMTSEGFIEASVAGEVPVIDISPLVREDTPQSDRLLCLMSIKDALSDKGIFLLINHGWSEQFIEDAFSASRAIFDLPEHQKMAVRMKDSAMRGYIPFGAESGLRDAVFEPKEGYAYGFDFHEPPKDTCAAMGDCSANYLKSENLWPHNLQQNEQRNVDFIDTLEELFARKSSLAKLLISELLSIDGTEGPDRAAVDDLNLDEGEMISVMRLFHYLPVEKSGEESDTPAGKAALGSAPHTDWGMLTLILQDFVGGLEYLEDNGQWYNVPCIKGSLVVNGGDFLSLLRPLKSPVHRVVSPGRHERFSFVFFFYPGFHTPMSLITKAAEENSSKDLARKDIPFNTLLDGGSADKFGPFIIDKWMGVSTY
eukprot:GSChrysophyteH1.ASY1.ANO1.2724.1 assembled CDS